MKLETNGWIKDMRGASGDIVFRRYLGRLIVAQKARRTDRPPTIAQLEVRDRFKRSVGWAKRALQNPTLAGEYRVTAATRESTAFALAAKDYHHAPVVREIGLADYRGRIGDPIVVKASDDFGITEVEVSVRDQAGNVLEQGVATQGLADDWSYNATTAVAAGQSFVIRAVARDRAGNEGTLDAPWAS